MLKLKLALGCALPLLCVAPAFAQAPAASAFGRLPAVQDVGISPDGRTIAVIGGAPDKRTLSMLPLDTTTTKQLDLGRERVQSVRWVDDQHALLSVVVWDVYDKQGYNFERNILVDADAKAGSALLATAETNSYQISQPVVGVTAGEKPYVTVQGIDWNARALTTRDSRISTGGENPFITVLWKVAVPSGKGTVSERGAAETDFFDVDLKGEARVRGDSSSAGLWTLKGRAKGQSAWKILRSSSEPDTSKNYLGYSDAEDAVYLASFKPDGGVRIDRLGLADGAQTSIAELPGDREVALIWDELKGAPVGLVSERDLPEYRWFDAEIGAAHGVFARAFKGKRVSLTGWSRDRTRFVALVEAPDSPPAWYLFDKPRKELSPLGEQYPELAGAQLGKTRFLTYKARDGLEIPAFLTLPPGAPEAGGKLPLVVLPHGGPAARDYFGFDYIVQYLATRGYAVLQPQFRGSKGFGETFEKAGHREWGGKIQTDILDGISHLAGQGVTASDRVCIVGASFGGYAALAGVSLNSDAYRCAAAIAGVSDLGAMLGETRISYGKDSEPLRQWTTMIGRTSGDKALIEAWSPAKQATKIDDPVLLIHGAYDTTVPIVQSRMMAKALQSAGKPVELVVLEGDDHYLSLSSTRTKTLESLGAFLAKHLPVN